MENELKRLLDAELRAEALVEEANQERERLIRQALDDARVAEAHFEARIPELEASFVEKAQERAEQAIAELERRYAERREHLRQLAAEKEHDALDAALTLLLDPERR
jgi:V/A-type H+-transporting ATPase subunit G/H